jgi:hypothetical protein
MKFNPFTSSEIANDSTPTPKNTGKDKTPHLFSPFTWSPWKKKVPFIGVLVLYFASYLQTLFKNSTIPHQTNLSIKASTKG